MSIDWTKPLRTRSLHIKAELVGPAPEKYHPTWTRNVRIGKQRKHLLFTESGKRNPREFNEYDLENVPESETKGNAMSSIEQDILRVRRGLYIGEEGGDWSQDRREYKEAAIRIAAELEALRAKQQKWEKHLPYIIGSLRDSIRNNYGNVHRLSYEAALKDIAIPEGHHE